MKSRSFAALATLTLAATSLAGCFSSEAFEALGEGLGDATAVIACGLGDGLAGYSEHTDTDRAFVVGKAPNATLVALGAREHVMWYLPTGIPSSFDTEFASTEGALEPLVALPSCGTTGQDEDGRPIEGAEPETYSFEVSLEAMAEGSDTIEVRVDGRLIDRVDVEVRAAAELAIEGQPVDAQPGISPSTNACATLFDDEGQELYAAESISWRVVEGDAMLMAGLFEISLDASTPIGARCVNISSESSEPIVVEASFGELRRELTLNAER